MLTLSPGFSTDATLMLTIKFSYVFLNYLIIHEMYTSWNLSGPAGTLSTLRFMTGKTTLHTDCKLNYACETAVVSCKCCLQSSVFLICFMLRSLVNCCCYDTSGECKSFDAKSVHHLDEGKKTCLTSTTLISTQDLGAP